MSPFSDGTANAEFGGFLEEQQDSPPPPSVPSDGADDDESNDQDCSTIPLITRSISGPLSSNASSWFLGSGWADCWTEEQQDSPPPPSVPGDGADDDESNDQDCSTIPLITRNISGPLSSDASSRLLGSGWTDCWTEAYHPPELSEIGGLPPPSMLSGGADDDESNDLDCNTTPLITRSISGPLSSDASSQCFGSGWVDFAGQGGATELAAGFQ